MSERVPADQDPRKNLPPIPDESVAGWKEIPIKGVHEELVAVGPFTQFSNCDTSAAYFGEQGEGRDMNFLEQEVNRDVSLLTHYMREGVYQRIQTAQSLLPQHHYFRFYDTYRPLEVQQALFDAQREKFQAAHTDWDDARLDEETQKYVSLPSPNPERNTTHPSPHSTGAALDLTIIRLNEAGQAALEELEHQKTAGELGGPVREEDQDYVQEVEDWISKQKFSEAEERIVREKWLEEYRYFRKKMEIFRQHSEELNMGTQFDHFGGEAANAYFEHIDEDQLTPEQRDARNNRRVLYDVMTQAGFANYPEEWWHWSYGDQMWAANLKKEEALYAGVRLNEENRAVEQSRRGVYSVAQNASAEGLPEVFV